MTQIFFEASPRLVVIYRDGRAAIIKQKQYDIINLAKEALTGLIWVPDPQGGEAVQWTDHGALLRLASAASGVAADMEG